MKNGAGKSVVMGLGRGLTLDIHADGYVGYGPSPETLRRANEMANYYYVHPDIEMQLLVSGGFPEVASKGKVKRPPQGISEAGFMEKCLLGQDVPEDFIKVEGRSGSTFENFILSILLFKKDFLAPGQFGPDNPLLLSVSEKHSWRSAIIAQQALDIPHNPERLSLFRLHDGRLENSLRMDTQERVACALTKLALLEVDAQPGNLEHTREASNWFNQQIQNPFQTLRKVGRHLGSLLSMPHIPIAAYRGE